MHEIEAKILEIDRARVVEKLERLGARCEFDGPIRTLYFDDPSGTLARRGDSLRLRREGDRATMTYKGLVPGSDGGVKVREELDTGVADFEVARAILESLGYTAGLEIRKHRSSYVLGDAYVVLDRHEGAHAHIPELLEIEAPSSAEVRRIAVELGYSAADLRPWTAEEVFEHYRRRNAAPTCS